MITLIVTICIRTHIKSRSGDKTQDQSVTETITDEKRITEILLYLKKSVVDKTFLNFRIFRDDSRTTPAYSLDVFLNGNLSPYYVDRKSTETHANITLRHLDIILGGYLLRDMQH